MIVKNDVRYRIDTLLRMASITNCEEKRQQYLLIIEELLSCGDTAKTDTIEFPFGDEKKMEIVNAFVNDYGESNIIGKINTQVYDAYVDFCNDIKSEPLSKLTFPKYLRKSTGIYIRQKKVNGKTANVYISANI